jgi:hypothetical protein
VSADEWLLTCLRSVDLDYLALKKKAVLASETSVTVDHSSQRNTHEALALVKVIATTTARITIITVFLGSLCGGRKVGSEEMNSGLILETSHARFLKRMCNILRAPKNF